MRSVLVRYEACDPAIRLAFVVSAAIVANGVYCIAYRSSIGDPVPVHEAMAWGAINVAPWVAAIEVGRHLRSSRAIAFTLLSAMLASLAMGSASTANLPDGHQLVRRIPGAAATILALAAIAALRVRKSTGAPVGSLPLTRDCAWLRAAGNYVEVHRESGKAELVRSTLGALLQGDGHGFVRIHRGYAVRRPAIAAVERNHVRLRDGTRLPIGNAYRAALAIDPFFGPSSQPG